MSANEAIRSANLTGKNSSAQIIGKKLELIMGFSELNKAAATELLKFRQLKEQFLPPQYSSKMAYAQIFSPYMTYNDFKWLLNFDKLIEVNSKLYALLLSDGKSSIYDYNLQYDVPVIVIAGTQDWTTPYPMALQYFNDISAPYKEFLSMAQTGHIPFMDRPKEFSQALMKALRNINNGQGSAGWN